MKYPTLLLRDLCFLCKIKCKFFSAYVVIVLMATSMRVGERSGDIQEKG